MFTLALVLLLFQSIDFATKPQSFHYDLNTHDM